MDKDQKYDQSSDQGSVEQDNVGQISGDRDGVSSDTILFNLRENTGEQKIQDDLEGLKDLLGSDG